MTPSGKTAGVPRLAEETHQGGAARADNTRSRRRKKKIQHLCYRKGMPPRQTQQRPPEKVGCSADPQG